MMIMYAWFFAGSEARSVNDELCPGVCSSGIVPDCNTLCVSYGYPGGYCRGLTCCCNPKFFKSSNIPLP